MKEIAFSQKRNLDFFENCDWRSLLIIMLRRKTQMWHSVEGSVLQFTVFDFQFVKHVNVTSQFGHQSHVYMASATSPAPHTNSCMNPHMTAFDPESYPFTSFRPRGLTVLLRYPHPTSSIAVLATTICLTSAGLVLPGLLEFQPPHRSRSTIPFKKSKQLCRVPRLFSTGAAMINCFGFQEHWTICQIKAFSEYCLLFDVI
jgi:hypothetical protein